MPNTGTNLAGKTVRPSFVLATRGAFLLATAAACALLIWFGWTGAGTRDERRLASQKALRVTELNGSIAYLDEWLTMSANMAASSGESRWAERYEEAVPKLDADIAEVVELATPESKAALAETAVEAHRNLVTMERRSLALVAQGDAAAARALLNGPEFAYLKDVYATGIEEIGGELKTLSYVRAAELDSRAWMEAGGLAFVIVLLVSTALMLRGHLRLKGALARTAAVARTDALTELPNRRYFYEKIEAMFADMSRTGRGCALLLIDLDRFKAANDAYGHLAGDQLLQLVAARLRAISEDDDLVARLGGDEFALVFLLDSPGQSRPSGDPATVAARVISVLKEPFELAEGALVRIGASVGIAVAHRGDGGATEFIHRADVALYRAKIEGRSCFRFFKEATDAYVRSLALLEGDLRQAIADDVIVPHFQPFVAMDTGQLIGFEMLARWPHPTRGMVPPADFIPIAEDLGLVGPMTERLLRKACRAAVNWPAHLTLACNVSPLQLRDHDWPEMVRAILDDMQFPAHRLELEVTESALVGDLELARTLLFQLKALGVRLALDDFGTGFSSLRHLQVLTFDKLKIDQSFVNAMLTDKDSAKIVSAVIGLGHNLGLVVVAEGVETPETAALLRKLGCDIGQGWLFGRTAAEENIGALLRDVTQMDPNELAIAS